MEVNKILLMIGLTLWLPLTCLGETILKGTVVEYRTDNKLSGITVTVQDSENQKELSKTKTSNVRSKKGTYVLKFTSDPTKFNITYDHPDENKYDPAGSYHIIKVSTEMGLDTIGLTNKQSGKKDDDEKAQNARNISGYIFAGGNIDRAEQAVKDANKRFLNYPSFAVSYKVVAAFEKKGIQFHFK